MGFGSGFGVNFTASTRFKSSGVNITKPSLAVGVSLAEAAVGTTLRITNNDADNPAVVDLAFSDSALQATSFHNGTATSPSYALEPAGAGGDAAGSYVDVALERGSGAPTAPGNSATCTVTALLGDGSSATTPITVNAPRLSAYVASLATPEYELKFEGNFDNTGNSASGFVNGNMTATATTANTGLTGKGVPDTILGHTRFGSSETNELWDATQTMIWVVNFTDTIDDNRVLAQFPYNANANFYEIRTNSSKIRVKVDGNNRDLHADQSGVTASSTASSKGSLTLGTGIKVIAACYNATSQTMKVRFKQSGMGAGHSLYTDSSAPADTSSYGSNFHLYTTGFGRSGYGSVDPDIEFLYFAWLDHEVTESEFDNICKMVGVGT